MAVVYEAQDSRGPFGSAGAISGTWTPATGRGSLLRMTLVGNASATATLDASWTLLARESDTANATFENWVAGTPDVRTTELWWHPDGSAGFTGTASAQWTWERWDFSGVLSTPPLVASTGRQFAGPSAFVWSPTFTDTVSLTGSGCPVLIPISGLSGPVVRLESSTLAISGTVPVAADPTWTVTEADYPNGSGRAYLIMLPSPFGRVWTGSPHI